MKSETITLETEKTMELIDITYIISTFLRDNMSDEGLCCIYNPHSTAGLTINEGADPDVCRDIIAGLKKIVPLNHPFKHQEGNSPAHIMSSLTGCSLTIPVIGGKLQLGTWQKVFFCEFDGPRTRKFSCNFVATKKADVS